MLSPYRRRGALPQLGARPRFPRVFLGALRAAPAPRGVPRGRGYPGAPLPGPAKPPSAFSPGFSGSPAQRFAILCTLPATDLSGLIYLVVCLFIFTRECSFPNVTAGEAKKDERIQ